MNISHASLNGFRSQHQHQHKGAITGKKSFRFSGKIPSRLDSALFG